MTEHDSQSALFSMIRSRENQYPELRMIFAVPNGGQRHPAVARKLHDEGVRAGVPDILVCIPAHGYNGLTIEMKYGKNRMTAEQQQYFAWFTAFGWLTLCYYDWQDAMKSIVWYLDLDPQDFGFTIEEIVRMQFQDRQAIKIIEGEK